MLRYLSNANANANALVTIISFIIRATPIL